MAAVFAVAAHATTLTWIPGSTTKVEQMIGDCDYTAQAKTGQCVPTTSQTALRARVLGTDLGASFESDGRVIFLFGDTISPTASENYFASDTMATSVSTDPSKGLFLDFFTNNDGSPYFVRIPGVRMGAGEVPHAGIRLNGSTYIAVTTGADISLPDPNINESSVLTRFDESTRRFTVLRTISSRPNGKFITTMPRQSGNDVYIFGLGAYRGSDVYLSVVGASDFATGKGTRYFTGLANGQPTWSPSESDAVPIVADDPPDIGNVSVIYSNELHLWLMTYDSSRSSPESRGFYFTYAKEPWGPWQKPQLIFNPTRDGATGTYIHDPRITPSDRLTGPTIGPNDPTTTPGGPYAPYMIERFTRVAGRTLSIYYTLSTWNPYTIVMMRSDFL
ncbi:MAG TPA: DUF4185 domain-containing protein, partial [Thermoanaerobaculia bacterium]|nr:DUF4185 domain-containing protein [Thermoanaerobaculia bacterium]